jgi:hypothetical protein
MTGREFTLDRFYFDSNDMFEWVKMNSHGLINWDEATLGGLFGNLYYWIKDIYDASRFP